MIDEHEFALCLTHDVDRIRKTFQGPYYALTRREPRHLLEYLTDDRPYWQFEKIMALESALGVRSAFYFLNEKYLLREKPPRAWFDPRNWVRYTGRYDVTADEIVDVIRRLDDGGWEVGLHGSYDSYLDETRLAYEKTVLEAVLGDEVRGGRQHYLNLEVPDTWRRQAAIGLRYDSSLGSASEVGFQHGYEPKRPFDDEFVVFPLTIMDAALASRYEDVSAAWRVCERLLEEAAENDAVMTVLWHPRYFNDGEYPGYTELYRRLVERAQAMGAWVGPPGELYQGTVRERHVSGS